MNKIWIGLILLVPTGTLTAQTLGVNRYIAHIPQLVSPMQAKFLTEAMVDLDADGTYTTDTNSGTLDMAVGRVFTRTVLEVHLAPYGFTVSAFSVLNEIGETGKMNGPDGFPAFINTGDLSADNATYQAAKSAWIAAHPEAYEQMIHPEGQDADQ